MPLYSTQCYQIEQKIQVLLTDKLTDSYFRPPAWSSGDPADLSVADSTAQPITALLLLHDDATLGTMHRLSRVYKSLFMCESGKDL